MAKDALETVVLRNEFYRDNYRRVVFGLLLMVFINIGCIGVIGYLITNRPEPVYFATSNDGKIIKLQPLTEPVISKAELLQWATVAATEANTYGFSDYRKRLEDASVYFTPGGWKEFQAALERSRNLETVISRKLVANAVATGAPIVTDQGVINGRYAWKIQLPLLITYESASTKIRQPVVVTMVVTRVSTLDTPKGIAIAQFYASERPISADQQ